MTTRDETSRIKPTAGQTRAGGPIKVALADLVEQCKRYQLLAKLAYHQIVGELPSEHQPTVVRLGQQASGFYHRLQEIERSLAAVPEAMVGLDAALGPLPDASQLRLSRGVSPCLGVLEVAARHTEILTPIYLRLAQLAPVPARPHFRTMGEQAVAQFIQLRLVTSRLRAQRPQRTPVDRPVQAPSEPVLPPRDVVADEQQQRALRGALVKGEFVIHYLPLLCLEQVQTCGVEVLLRWRHPTRGLVDAREFIANAEQAKVLIPVGRWMLRSAIALVQQWEAAQPSPLRLAVNLSACELEAAEMAREFRSILDETAFPALQIDLEVQEELLLNLGAVALRNLGALRKLGCRVVADGGSPRLLAGGLLDAQRVDRVKLSAGRVLGAGAAEGWSALLAAARHQGIAMTATHVEHRAALFKMRHLGCDEAQGFAIGQPAPAEVARGWFEGGPQAPWGGTRRDTSGKEGAAAV